MELKFFFYVFSFLPLVRERPFNLKGEVMVAGTIVFVEEETTELKQPVCKRGSILLGELIAIKIVLEYIDQQEIRRKIEQLTIFSDSECYCYIFGCFSDLLKYQISTFDFLFLCSSV
jgi:hypothetical protein